MTENQDDKKPMDIVAEEKLKKWLKDVGLDDDTKEKDDDQNE